MPGNQADLTGPCELQRITCWHTADTPVSVATWVDLTVYQALTWLLFIFSSQQVCEGGILIIPAWQLNRLRFRGVKSFAQILTERAFLPVNCHYNAFSHSLYHHSHILCATFTLEIQLLPGLWPISLPKLWILNLPSSSYTSLHLF